MTRSFLASAAIYGLADFVSKFLAFAVFPLYAHIFSVEEFGVIALVTTAAGLVALILNLGMNNAMQRFYLDPATEPQARPKLVSTGLAFLAGWSLVVTLLLIACSAPLRDLLQHRYHVGWILLALALATNIPAQILQYSQDVLRIHFSPWKFTVTSLLKNVAGAVFALILILLFGYGLEGFFWGYFAAAMLALPLSLWFIRGDLVPRFDAALARQMVVYGYPFIFGGLAYWVFGSLDVWMLTELSDNTNVGWYSIAAKFAAILTFINAAFGQAWAPFALKAYAEDPGHARLFSRVFSYWFFGLTIIGMLISLFGYELLWALTPQPYWPAAGALSALAMGAVLLGTTQVTVLGISLARKTSVIAHCAWMVALLNLVLNFLLIPRFGALGTSIATFLSYAVLSALYLYYSQRLHPIPLEKGKLLLTLAFVLLTVFVSIVLQAFPWSITIFAVKLFFLAGTLGIGFRFGILEIPVLVRLLRDLYPARRAAG
ncbi:MAG: oligosaccharide flippase family protein [Burkholderiales bacterium]